MENEPTQNPPEFYTGAPVDSADLRFRGDFIEHLWRVLATRHVLLTAPRRTGKTSVMDFLKHNPPPGYLVVGINVQDLAHPADLFEALLDAFVDAYPNYVRDTLATGMSWLQRGFDRLENIDLGGIKIALRDSDPNWRDNWRIHGADLLRQIRNHATPALLIIDELPDMLINTRRDNEALLREFLAWWRSQRQQPAPKQDRVRWLVGGSVNLQGTLDAAGMLDLINDLEPEVLPALTDGDIHAFVEDMLNARGVAMTPEVPERVIARLGRPIPLFMQMATQDLYRAWQRTPAEARKPLNADDVDAVFDALVKSSAARDRLQHYYSRINRYYVEPALSAAYTLLSKLSLAPRGLSRTALLGEFERVLFDAGVQAPEHQRRQAFNELLRDLENDFYVEAIDDEHRYDFTSGVLKAWWAKYYA